ncbi:MAG: hypothetical protein AAFU73_13005 [Planctomycetota bacterium]
MTFSRIGTLAIVPVFAAAAVLIAGSTGPLRAAAARAPKAQIAGVRISPEVAPKGEYGPNLAFQGTLDPVTLAVLVEAPEGGLIAFDRESSTLDTFVDSAGNTLHETEGFFGPWGMNDRVLGGGTSIVVELSGKQSPAPNARFIEANGTLVVLQAFEKITHKSGALEFQKGAKANVGPFQIEFEGIEKAQWRDGWEMNLKTDADLASIVEWAVVSPNGDRMVLERTSTMTFNGTSHIGLQLPMKTEKGALELLAWKDPKSIEVPFAAKVRVGIE